MDSFEKIKEIVSEFIKMDRKLFPNDIMNVVLLAVNQVKNKLCMTSFKDFFLD